MSVDEFLNNTEEMVYEIPDDDNEIIEDLVKIFKKQLEDRLRTLKMIEF